MTNDSNAVAGQLVRGVRPDGDLALLMLAQQAELDAGPPYLMSMLKGDTAVGDFQERLALLMRAAVAAERERLARLAEGRTDGWHSLTPAEIRAGRVGA